MKVFLMAVIIASTQFALAQNDAVVPAPTEKAADVKGAIKEPTKEQLKTLPKKKAVTPPVEKKTEVKTEEKVETVTPTEDKTVIETKKTEIKTEEKNEPSSNPHLFGFHGDVNVPHILNYGLDYWHSSRWFSVAANFGGYSAKKLGKSDTDPEGVDLKISNQDLALRLHPFQGAFYVGAMYGQHTLEGKKTATYSVAAQSRTTTLTNTIKANYFTPHIGWLWKASFGLTFGIDLGYLNPSGVKTTLDEGDIVNDPLYPTLQAQQDYKDNKTKLEDESKKLGSTGIPYLALIRLGWLF